ncbi:MAG: hypothetical protein ABL886_14715 [Rhodoglobus sp.]
MKRNPKASALRSTFEATPEGKLRITLSGGLDESADLDGLFARIDRACILNLRGVERVNSMGVHNWLVAISKVSSKHRLVVEEISYGLVQNAIAVTNLFGSADVVSCLAPYACARCDAHVVLTVRREEVFAAGGGPPTRQCERCGSNMEFEEIDGYFSFFRPPRSV